MKKYGEQYNQEWERAWKRSMDAKQTAMNTVSRKIGMWKKEQAEKLNNMSHR